MEVARINMKNKNLIIFSKNKKTKTRRKEMDLCNPEEDLEFIKNYLLRPYYLAESANSPICKCCKKIDKTRFRDELIIFGGLQQNNHDLLTTNPPYFFNISIFIERKPFPQINGDHQTKICKHIYFRGSNWDAQQFKDMISWIFNEMKMRKKVKIISFFLSSQYLEMIVQSWLLKYSTEKEYLSSIKISSVKESELLKQELLIKYRAFRTQELDATGTNFLAFFLPMKKINGHWMIQEEGNGESKCFKVILKMNCPTQRKNRNVVIAIYYDLSLLHKDLIEISLTRHKEMQGSNNNTNNIQIATTSAQVYQRMVNVKIPGITLSYYDDISSAIIIINKKNSHQAASPDITNMNLNKNNTPQQVEKVIKNYEAAISFLRKMDYFSILEKTFNLRKNVSILIERAMKIHNYEDDDDINTTNNIKNQEMGFLLHIYIKDLPRRNPSESQEEEEEEEDNKIPPAFKISVFLQSTKKEGPQHQLLMTEWEFDCFSKKEDGLDLKKVMQDDHSLLFFSQLTWLYALITISLFVSSLQKKNNNHNNTIAHHHQLSLQISNNSDYFQKFLGIGQFDDIWYCRKRLYTYVANCVINEGISMRQRWQGDFLAIHSYFNLMLDYHGVWGSNNKFLLSFDSLISEQLLSSSVHFFIHEHSEQQEEEEEEEEEQGGEGGGGNEPNISVYYLWVHIKSFMAYQSAVFVEFLLLSENQHLQAINHQGQIWEVGVQKEEEEEYHALWNYEYVGYSDEDKCLMESNDESSNFNTTIEQSIVDQIHSDIKSFLKNFPRGHNIPCKLKFGNYCFNSNEENKYFLSLF
jgi:hypothetical protein